MILHRHSSHFALLGALVLLASCADVSHVQNQSPANAFKDYRPENALNSAVLGIGEPINARQIKANATIGLQGSLDLNQVMERMAGTYNVAIRWGDGVRRNMRKDILVADLTFDEARGYIEDVYNVQIIREGDRRLLILPSAAEERIEEFLPGQSLRLLDVVRGLAEQCGYNIVIAENRDQLSGITVSTKLRDMTCFDAFGALLNPHGLSLIDRGDYYEVGGLPTKQWLVNLHEPNRTDTREVNYTSSFSSQNEDTGSSQNVGGKSEVKISSERRLWEELQADLNGLLQGSCARQTASANDGGQSANLLPPPDLGDGENASADGTATAGASLSSGASACGYVRINKTVGLVQMQARQEVLDQADEIISKVEDVASRRLLLEARVLAVKRERKFEQGSRFNLSGFDRSNGVLGLGSEGRLSSITSEVNSALTAITGTTASGGGGFFGLRGKDLDVVQQFVEEFGTTYQLMQPMIELMDRQQATLIDGSTQPFILRTVEEETTELGTNETVTTELKYQFFGLQFSAAAQIAEAGQPHTVSIQIPILTKVDDFEVPVFSGSVQITSDLIPVPETRLIDQKVRIRDGEIKVIGGLTKTIAIDKEAGVPLARDFPVFGKLVNEENIQFEDVEFVVLLQARRIY